MQLGQAQDAQQAAEEKLRAEDQLRGARVDRDGALQVSHV